MSELALGLQKHEDALRLANRANSLRPNGLIPAKAVSGMALWELGQKNQAINIARSVRQSWPSDPRGDSDIYAINILLQAGLEEEVNEYAEMLFSEFPTQHHKRGFLLMTLGRLEEAIPYLERMGVLNMPMFALDTMFDPYRDNPHFHKLISTLNWADEYQRARTELEMVKQQRRNRE